jgi:hypothetical protein
MFHIDVNRGEKVHESTVQEYTRFQLPGRLPSERLPGTGIVKVIYPSSSIPKPRSRE